MSINRQTSIQMHRDLVSLGVRKGGCLMVHSSFKSLQTPGLAPEDVIHGLLEALGSNGTLLMPALTYERVTPDNPYFDVLFTPSNVGIIPETFRKTSGVIRSVHPTHSVCALGKLADRITQRHQLDRTPCGVNSPFSQLPELGGQILMLGCGLEPNTSMHGVEELVEPDYLYDPLIEYHIVLENGSKQTIPYRPHNFQGWAQRYDRIEHGAGDWLRHGKVLGAECWLIEAGPLWQYAVEQLRADQHAFVEPIPKA